MKNKVISILLLLLSLFAFGINLNSARAYYYTSKGNSFFKSENFEEARKNYELSLKLKDNLNVKKNIIKSFYEEKKYKEVIENESDEFFLRGNSYAFLGDSLIKENPEEAKKNYRLALEEYKKAMKQSDDINIKKNYEIVLKKIEDLEKEQQQNQDNQNKQDKQQENKDNNQQNQNNQNNQNNKDNQEQNQENNNQNNSNNQDKQDKNNQNDQQQKNNDSNNQDQKDKSQDNKQQNNKQNDSDNNNQKDNNNQDQQNNSGGNQENSNQPQDQQDKNQGGGVSTGDIKDSKEDIKKNEIGVILKRLEGNEKQSFKNNERVMNIETGNSNNKW
jgi:Ca-activated chloride channel family protein